LSGGEERGRRGKGKGEKREMKRREERMEREGIGTHHPYKNSGSGTEEGPPFF